MNGNETAAMAALRGVTPIAARLDKSREGEDRAADILELWQGTETALRALMGGSSLTGQGLIRELRQKELISLGQAYALLEFLGARDRANRTSYKATDNDVVVAREGFRQLESGLSSAVSEPAAPPIPQPYAASSSPDYSRPPAPAYAAAGAAAATAGRSTAPPPPASYGQPAETPSGPQPTYTEKPSRIPRNMWFIVALLVLVVAAIGGYMVFAKRKSPDAAMSEAVAAMQSGRREAAKGQFGEIARENPNMALPHVFLARLSREEGDIVGARAHLDAAIRIDPKNARALREMGLILFSTGSYEVSRRFFIRALEADPADNASQGYLGCALARLNRLDEAQRFIARAGPGAWSSCLPNRPL
ncbi:MAG TPA: tetratricopeptide repeat protein [Gemmatimonadaceae bacterium]|nr:tetratricopeptide repeat protein [Gemmatimonadaceae bacterium]